MSETTESERAVTTNRRSLALWLCLAIGIGVALAPVVFQMFTRAPAGGDMIDDFAPYMTSDEIVQFEEYMHQIDAANTESAVLLRDDLDVPEIPEFLEMLTDMGANLWACQMSVDMMDLSQDDLFDGVIDIINVSEFMELSADAQVVFV